MCGGVNANALTTGSASVTVRDRPAARLPAPAAHNAVITTGSSNVFIGGPSASLVGRVTAGGYACQALAAGRASGKSTQTWGNCGVETMRQIVNAAREKQGLPPYTEDKMLALAIAAGAVAGPDSDHFGGLGADANRKMMEQEGVPVDISNMSNEEIAAAVAAGCPVGAWVDVSGYWTNGQSGMHEVLVTGVERDADGNITAVFVNDSGLGSCGMRIPIGNFNKARTDKNGNRLPAVKPRTPVF